MSTKANNYYYLDVLRAVAAFAVVMIHVLGPWRHLYGVAPGFQWEFAVSYNAVTRWAVPVFMMISGALLLSSKKPFNCSTYLNKRVSKVVIPFIAWSLIYTTVTWYSQQDFSAFSLVQLVINAINEPAWYHLWFFYDFIPLYFVVPFLAIILNKMDKEHIKLLVISWFVLTLMHWLKVDSWLRQNLVLYTGYLILGWYLHNNDCRKYTKTIALTATIMLLINVFGTLYFSEMKQKYSVFFLGYKSFNTALIACALFLIAKDYSHYLHRFQRPIASIAMCSLGIYLIHPLLLIPVRELSNGYYQWFGSNLVAIPTLSLLVMMVAWSITRVVIQIPVLKRLVP
ncbi:acyltransferase [Ferrimonas aestuarii]|uniref:Acyltransferase n=1 Tax=Ferrimonas aestuarii TaxID=2569539 RepID=A0A4U1BRB7_9GAMM|nr:acyltransferase family protein [Ferrimonas aestuarii]TKB57384.1 acyltransferase [Ferrimonas aestuarii]